MQVSDIIHNPPLGKSDHDVLTFDFHCYVDFTKPKEKLNYAKGNYQAMRDYLLNSSWRDDFYTLGNKETATSEELWLFLKTKLLELIDKFVPRETPSGKPAWRDKGSIPLDQKTRLAIQAKEKSHRQWMAAKKRDESDIAKLEHQQLEATQYAARNAN